MSSLLCRKSTKTYGKTNTFGGIWYARQIISVILIFLKTLFLGKTEDAIIFQRIPARDIVSHSNCRFGKQRQKICLIALVIAGFFPMPESNWKYRMKDCQNFSTSAHVLSLQFDSSTRKPFACPSMPPFHNPTA